jgi:hypothetical protein
MRYILSLLLCVAALPLHALLWSGILNPTSGAGACSFGQIASAGQCAIDWTATGIPSGIPTTWTQSGATIAAQQLTSGVHHVPAVAHIILR